MLKGDMMKLNTLLSKNGQLSHVLELESTLMEADLLHRLKAQQDHHHHSHLATLHSL